MASFLRSISSSRDEDHFGEGEIFSGSWGASSPQFGFSLSRGPSNQESKKGSPGTSGSLFAAVHNGALREVKASLLMLKGEGIQVDGKNFFGTTALHLAVWKNNIPMVQMLLEAGADPEIKVRLSLESSSMHFSWFSHSTNRNELGS